MDALVATVLSVWISFCLGAFIVLWVGRGFMTKYIRCFITGSPLIRVHLQRGGFVFRVGANVPAANAVKYSLWGKKDVRYCSVVPEAVLSAVRVKWIDVPELETAPFVYDKVEPFYENRMVPVIDEKTGNQQKDENNVPLYEKKPVLAFRKFVGWDDSAVVRTMVQWALMRPRRKIGGFDPRAIIIIIVVIIVVLLFATQIGSAGAGNVIG